MAQPSERKTTTNDRGPLCDPQSIRLHKRTKKRLKKSAAALDLNEQDTHRLALDIGLQLLEHTGHDLAHTIVAQFLHQSRVKP